MKRKLVMILAVVMAGAMFAGGCGNKDKAAGTSASAEAEGVQIPAKELLKATDYDVEDYVTLNDYMNMTVELSSSYEVEDEEIQTYVEYLMSMYPSYEATDKKTVEEGDIVNIDYKGTKDGEAFDVGTAEGAHLEIGSGSFIDGFEDGLIGKNVGETVELNLTFPENYQAEDLAGQDVVFTVTINSIDEAQEMLYEDLTDEYVSSNFGSSGVSTVEDLKNQIRSTLEAQNANSKMQEIQTRVLSKLVQECQVELPEGLLDEKIADYKARLQKDADAAEQSLSDYLSSTMNMTEEQLDEELNDYMDESLKQELILEAIVQDQDISISESDFSTFINNYITTYGVESEEKFYEEYGGEDYLKLSYAENQALLQVIGSVRTTVAEEASGDGAQASDDAQEDAGE